MGINFADDRIFNFFPALSHIPFPENPERPEPLSIAQGFRSPPRFANIG